MVIALYIVLCLILYPGSRMFRGKCPSAVVIGVHRHTATITYTLATERATHHNVESPLGRDLHGTLGNTSPVLDIGQSKSDNGLRNRSCMRSELYTLWKQQVCLRIRKFFMKHRHGSICSRKSYGPGTQSNCDRKI